MAKRKIDNYVFSPGMSYKGYVYPDAYSLLDSNTDYIIAEAIAYITNEVSEGNAPFAGYTYNEDKCKRDIGFILSAYKNDLRYGGNARLYDYASRYYENGVAQIDGDRLPEVSTHTYIRNLITDYIFTNTAFTSLQTEVSQVIDTSKVVYTDLQYTPTGVNYKPATGVMVITLGAHALSVGDEIHITESGLTFTCALDAHATDHAYPRGSGAPNASGHDPFWDAPVKITAATTTTITVNIGISSNTSPHLFVSALTNAVKSGPSSKIKVLANRLVDTIENGLTKLPTRIKNGYGYVKIQGKYDLSDLLLISNNTTNTTLFNFTNNDTGAVISTTNEKIVSLASDEDFPKYSQATDGVTTLKLNADTSTQSATDDIQIFVEDTENGRSITRTRPYDFGTDAIERMRVAPALSMLDADFEYGLQPTKWSAIGMMRGYPSIYEVPGSEKNVLSVVTDASAGTEGIGQSLITVTTIGPHGIEAGQPITIKALEDSVNGASRAEGSFVVISVPSSTTFTYYAKAKVGTVNPTTLSTTYTQLREAGFYTGSNISVSPEFTVVSNGFSGVMTAELNVAVGSNILPYDGNTPEIGAPLVSGSNIPSGAQVTQAITQSSGGGLYLTADLVGDAGAGDNQLEVADATGIITGLAFDRGDGTAIYINQIEGETLTFNDTFTRPIIGGTATYSGISGSNIDGIGFDAQFDISYTGGVYTVDTIADGGEAYEIGDRIFITAEDIGGITPANDLVLIVDSVFSIGVIDGVTVEGTSFSGTGQVSGIIPDVDGGLGFSGTFNVGYTDNSYDTITISQEGEAYTVNDIVIIAGDNVPSGSSPTNDVRVVITGIDSIGGITSATVSGTAPDASAEYDPITSAEYAYSGSTGSGAEFRINRDGSVYSATVTSVGVSYLPTETFVISGAELGGSSPTNDCTITIDNVDGSGGITAVSSAGVAANTNNIEDISGSNLVGSAAQFTVDIAAGAYTVTVDQGGQDYGVNQTFTISGSELAGADITNDLTITITAVDATGLISTVSSAGTANNGTATFTGVSGINQASSGTGALFDVVRNAGTYSVTLDTGGTDYAVGNRILLLGSQLGGQSPLNDITVSVDTVTTGVIATISESYEEAVLGDVGDFIATVTMSESTTGTISRLDDIIFSSLATIEIEFPAAHGLVPGDTFIVTTTSDDGSNNHDLSAGSFIATNIPSITTLRFQARAPGNITDTDDSILGTIYPRPDSFFIHRPYDGGVQLGTGGPQHGAQAIRQSKNYIRYQSGKGIMYTTGALFAPSYDLRSVTSNGVEKGATITITTDDNDHGLQIGGVVRLIGVETEGYNSGPETYFEPSFDYTVSNIIDERTFEVLAERRLGATSAVLGFAAQMSVVSWHGATVRSGIFDDQNGIFWEYDGTNLNVAQRTGTKQIAGTISLKVDENVITGTNTRFQDQLKAGDRIIIKGMTHVVTNIASDTSMTVTPDFRGVINIAGAKAMLISDKKVKQQDFNLDSLDGTGPSGYNLDYAKMQMIGIQYSWYGAGFIDFMLRGSDGNFVFAHRMRNSNVNTEAFMRSGNLPVRYEVTNEGPPGKLSEAMDVSQNTMELEDTSFFPTTGTVYVDNEIIRFTGNNKATNTLTGLTRGSTLTNFQAGAARAYAAGDAAAHNNKTGVILISSTITPLISHWGSAFITDGGFDEDRGYIFSYTEPNINVTTIKQTAFLIRLAPSVSNAIIGDLGERELLNRAQLLLQGIECTSETGTGGIVIEGVLNPKNYPLNPNNITWQTLATEAQGGQPSFAQIAAGGSVQWSTGAAAVNTTATAASTATAQLNSGQNNTGNNRDIVWISATDYRNTFGSNDIGIVSGLALSGNGIQADTFITGGYISPSSNYGYFRISPRTNGGTSRNTSNAFTVSFGGALENRNFAYFDKTSFEASNATAGTAVTQSGGDVNFPSNSSIANVSLENFAGTEFYEVTFNNTFSGTLAAGTGVVQFEFIEPPFAQPGETVFSFIAQPGERAELMLDKLKELTNTTLGGRGTFPNGPDVLAINIYKVTGAAVSSNVILRWGEAQA